MADTFFEHRKTPILADWLNDVNELTYGLTSTVIGKGASLVTYLATGVGSVAQTVADYLSDEVRVTSYMTMAQKVDARGGFKTLDLTAAIQACIDANKGKEIVFPSGYKYWLAGVLLSGATYNGTRLNVKGEVVLKPAPTLGTKNYQGAWIGIIFEQVEDGGFTGRFNGDRAAQQNSEQTPCLALAGCKNFKIPWAEFNEVRGDGLYVGMADWFSPSTNSDGLTVGTISGYNSADDGRNLLTIISCDNWSVDSIHSVNIGGTVGGAVMPGGFDVEPNYSHESCKNGTVGSANIVSAGTSGFSIQGVTGTSVTDGVVVGSVNVINTCAPSINDAAGNLTQTNNHTLIILSAKNVKIAKYNGKFTNAYGDGVIVSDADGAEVHGGVSHVREGVRIGNDSRDVAGPGVTNSDIDLKVSDVSKFGFRTGKLTDCNILGRVIGPVAGFYTSTLMGVQAMVHTQTRVKYSVSVKASTDWVRSYRNDASTPATFVDCSIEDCNLTGTWAAGVEKQAGDMRIMRRNVKGITDVIAAPTIGVLYPTGQRFWNISGTIGAPKSWVISSTNVLTSEGNL